MKSQHTGNRSTENKKAAGDAFTDVLNKLGALVNVKLAADPVAGGLSVMSATLADVTNKTLEATRIANKVIGLLASKSRELENLQSMYAVRLSGLMASDEYVTSAPTRQERESRAQTMLRSDLETIESVKDSVARLEALRECAENTLRSLKIAKECASRQWSVIERQIELGEVDGRRFGGS